MNEETTKKITDYVYKNYKTLKDKQLTIKEKENCFHVLVHKDASPLILGKGILK
mgnify:CR=1 FL=1